jgi:hypothetical protein
MEQILTAAVGFLVIAAALIALWLAARGAITVCVAEVRDGKLRVTRGGIAPRLLADLGDVIARPPVRQATLRIVRDSGRARLEATGDLTEVQRQQLRNVIGSVPLATLANTPRGR